jgi:hypothetical protein
MHPRQSLASGFCQGLATETTALQPTPLDNLAQEREHDSQSQNDTQCDT